MSLIKDYKNTTFFDIYQLMKINKVAFLMANILSIPLEIKTHLCSEIKFNHVKIAHSYFDLKEPKESWEI